MMLTVKPGEKVDILLMDVEVVTAGSPSLEVLYRAGANREAYALYINPDSPNLVVTRVAPLEWPPQIGDVWADAHGHEWWCRPEPAIADAEAYLQSQKGGVDDPAWVLRQYGPMTLVYRKGWSPTPAVDVEPEPDKPESGGPVGRAATIAGLRELADFFEARPDLPIDAYTVDARRYIRHDKRLDTDDAKHAELERLAAIMGVEPMDREKAPYPEARHRYAVKKFSGGVAYEVILTDAWVAPEPAADVSPPAGDAVTGVAASVTAPAGAERAKCSYCGGPIWKGLIWVHEQTEDARCPGDETFYATPVCGAVFEGKPGQDPCRKPRGHEHGPETDWKRDLHSNGLLKWRVDEETPFQREMRLEGVVPDFDPPGDDLSIAVSPDEPEVGGYWCTVTSQRCTAETDPCHLCPTAADPIPADEAAV